MSYITKQAIKVFYDELTVQNLLESDVKNINIKGNILNIESALENKIFTQTIIKNMHHAKQKI